MKNFYCYLLAVGALIMAAYSDKWRREAKEERRLTQEEREEIESLLEEIKGCCKDVGQSLGREDRPYVH
jgi:hypothetical protein